MRLQLIMPTKLFRLKREAVYSIACEDELEKNVQRDNIGLPDYLGGCPKIERPTAKSPFRP